MGRKWATLLCLSLALSLGSSCRRSPAPVGVQTAPGTYRSRNGQFQLVVGDTSAGTVAYTVTNTQSGQVVAAGDAGSTYQRWFFYWDDSNRLWVHSSDIGTCVWVPESSGLIRHPLQKGSPLVQGIPKAVAEQLPRSSLDALGP